MKRARHLFEIATSDENLSLAIDNVNKTHHWKVRHHPNKVTAWVEETKTERIKDLKEIITNGFEPKPPHVTQRWDASSQKWRTVSEPAQWPDQYVHHALIQALQPTLMRGMDPYCCGSIRGRGPHLERRAIERWMAKDYKGTKYEFIGDIHQFYSSLKPEIVMDRMRQLIKDHRVLDLIWRIIKDGILIGAYTSQWFANSVLQPLDNLIRQSGLCNHYARYMDNLTVFGANKRKMKRLKDMVEKWLLERGLELKGDWQVFRTSKSEPSEPLEKPRNGLSRAKMRMPDAVGYRYGRGYTIPRKRNLLRIKRALSGYRKRGNRTTARMAASLISRLGQLKHCNNCNLYKLLYNGERIERELKNIIRKNRRKEILSWTTYLAQRATLKLSAQRETNTAT